MTRRIEASALVRAPVARVYGIIADYREGHPRILPEQFTGLQVEQGGRGAGTVIQVQMRLLGQTRRFRATITEPSPGRVLAETDAVSGTVTTFTVDHAGDAGQARVTITTDLPVRPGLAGSIEAALTAVMLRRIYARELQLLATVAEVR